MDNLKCVEMEGRRRLVIIMSLFIIFSLDNKPSLALPNLVSDALMLKQASGRGVTGCCSVCS